MDSALDTARPAAPTLRSEDPGGGSFRADIQGLRAVAVSLVLLYHLWPNRLTGGFIGVDVFFVISGFLITTRLVARPATSLRAIGQFYAQRVRRLIPAAFLVLAATLVGSRLFAPETEWARTAREGAGATAYVVNWLLARSSVDYLNASSAPSPVQHYWSLSVEEQFYLGWPLLIALLAAAATPLVRDRLARITLGLAVVSAASLAYSVVATADHPASAYFVTPTRIWELGLGGVLAAATLLARERGYRLGRAGGSVRSLLVVVGLAAVVWSAVAFSSSTPIPGWRALVPVLGAVAVIAGGTGAGPTGPGHVVLGNRPAQWLGDVSYSVYLWHWPLVVLVPSALGHPLHLLDKLAVIAVTLVLSALTKTYVEDRWRLPHLTRMRPTFVWVAAGMAALLALCALQLGEVHVRSVRADAAVRKALANPSPCLGAGALAHRCPVVSHGSFIPNLSAAPTDRAQVYADGCLEIEPFPGTASCVYGARRSGTTLAVVGNSHAAAWMPAITRVARAEGWKVRTYLAAQCTPSTVVNSQDSWTSAKSPAGCLAWARRVRKALLAQHPDLVLMTAASGGLAVGTTTRDASVSAWTRGYRTWLAPVLHAGIRVAVLHDTPWPLASYQEAVPDCVAAHAADWRPCGGPRSTWMRDDPLVDAVAGSRRTDVIDLTDEFCRSRFCPAVTGGVLVYADNNHMTATYSATLAPYLDGPLAHAMATTR